MIKIYEIIKPIITPIIFTWFLKKSQVQQARNATRYRQKPPVDT